MKSIFSCNISALPGLKETILLPTGSKILNIIKEGMNFRVYAIGASHCKLDKRYLLALPSDSILPEIDMEYITSIIIPNRDVNNINPTETIHIFTSFT